MIGIFKLLLLSHVFVLDTFVTGFSVANQWNKGSISANKGPIIELKTEDAVNLFKKIPPMDYVVLFYTPWNNNCRIFMDIFKNISHYFSKTDKQIQFATCNCQGMHYSKNICHDYNITSVPTLAYISSVYIQRHKAPQQSFLTRAFGMILPQENDISIPNATRYKGDLFIYEQVVDWISIMVVYKQ
ncbi:bifunctional Thioredoxin domain/Thioredoxin-like superfamily [Babesia duncani]|uniref:Bifunctional Thioredoxin domain/Thioredoxin-like superfamily n=1 Tax=Babesia duncani TaxID=323732 RepID=A0AAD9PNN9_9APIC|nr:bifunctional Thioredoxin domain/Thioredoxin-like superfamily [Babesia duncani]